MAEMIKVKIKQVGTKVGTEGLHFGGGKCRRPLRPGEVVALPEDFEGGILDAYFAQDVLEITRDPVTRPLDFDTELEARYTDPKFRTTDRSVKEQAETVIKAVKRKLQDGRRKHAKVAA